MDCDRRRKKNVVESGGGGSMRVHLLRGLLLPQQRIEAPSAAAGVSDASCVHWSQKEARKREEQGSEDDGRRRVSISLSFFLPLSGDQKRERESSISRHHRHRPPARGRPARRLLSRSPATEAPETDLVSAHVVLLCVALSERNARACSR